MSFIYILYNYSNNKIYSQKYLENSKFIFLLIDQDYFI